MPDPNKRAAVMTYDNAGRFALATAIKCADGVARIEDSGGELPDGPTAWPKASLATIPANERQEAFASLARECTARASTLYPSNLQQHAEADAIALAQTL